MPDLPSLELSITGTDANGTVTRYGSDSRNPRFIPQDISFATQRMSGFTTASFTLRRKLDDENPDLALLNEFTIWAADGTIVYEGKVTNTPRSFDESGHSVTVSLTGHISSLAQTKCRPVFVDRDLSAFTGESSATRRSNLLTAGYLPQSNTAVTPDATGQPGVRQQFERIAHAHPPTALVESWYDAGPGNTISQVYVDLTSYSSSGGGIPLAAPWKIFRMLATDDAASATEAATTLGGTYSGYYTVTATNMRYLMLLFYFDAVNTIDGLWSVTWRRPAVYCTTIPLVGDTDPKGVLASDVITWLANTYAPTLNTTGVQATSTPIGHLAVRTRTTPYDIMLQANGPHLWWLGCWENKRLTYGPLDLTGWDWEIRHDEIGNQILLQGDSTEDFANGIVVTFTNVGTGAVEELHPDDYDELRDDAIDNPANMHGETIHTDYELSWPTTRATALAIGEAALNEYNAPKAPGSFTVTGHIRDRQGNMQPASKVRAGDRVRLTSSASLSDRPRPVVETGYSDSGKTVTISVDSTLQQLDAIVDRLTTDLRAEGLSG